MDLILFPFGEYLPNLWNIFISIVLSPVTVLRNSEILLLHFENVTLLSVELRIINDFLLEKLSLIFTILFSKFFKLFLA